LFPYARNAAEDIGISTNDTRKYSVTAFEVTPGQKVSITLMNNGTALKTAGGHNFVVVQKNTNVNRFLEAASLEASHDYLSAASQKNVLASTKLLGRVKAT
jgi:azurin